jgi:cation diffusion facilitator CzcD-associated flavoprotein CzcO
MFNALTPGWQREWLMNFATLQSGGFAEVDLVKDGWTDIAKRIRDRVLEQVSRGEYGPRMIQTAYETSDDEKMTEIRARVDAIVRDATTAEGLKPWYRQLCKRPCFHDEYLDTFNQPGVHLVDTDGKGVERIDATGAWVAGVHYDLDCLIFASGFEVGTEHARRAGFETIGRDGVTLSDHWKGGMRSMHGIHTRGFPNAFFVSLTQAANLVSNVTHNLVEAGTTIAAIIAHALKNNVSEVEVTADAEREWIATLQGNSMAFAGIGECTPGYYNNEGQPIDERQTLNMSRYPHGPVAYFEYIDTWRTSGKFEGLEFRRGE